MHIDGSHSQSYKAYHPNHPRGGDSGSRAEFAAKAREVRSLQSAPADEVARAHPKPVRVGPLVDAVYAVFRSYSFGQADNAGRTALAPSGTSNSTAEAAASRPNAHRGASRIADGIVSALSRLDFGGPVAGSTSNPGSTFAPQAAAPVVDVIIDALRDFSAANTSVPSQSASAASATTAETGPVSVSSEALKSVADTIRGVRLDFRPGTNEVTVVTPGSGSSAGEANTDIVNAIADKISSFQLSSSSGESAGDQIAAAVEALQLAGFQEDLDAIVVLNGTASAEGERAAGGFLAAIADVIRGLQVSDPNTPAPAVVAAKPQPSVPEPATAVKTPVEVATVGATDATTATPEAVTAPQAADVSDITIPGASLNQFASVREAFDLRSALVEALLGDGSNFLETFSDRSFDFSVEISARYQSDTEQFEVGERFELKA